MFIFMLMTIHLSIHTETRVRKESPYTSPFIVYIYTYRTQIFSLLSFSGFTQFMQSNALCKSFIFCVHVFSEARCWILSAWTYSVLRSMLTAKITFWIGNQTTLDYSMIQRRYAQWFIDAEFCLSFYQQMSSNTKNIIRIISRNSYDEVLEQNNEAPKVLTVVFPCQICFKFVIALIKIWIRNTQPIILESLLKTPYPSFFSVKLSRHRDREYQLNVKYKYVISFSEYY